MDSKFDILDYLNDIYLHKMGNDINVLNAGGHFNRMGDNENKEEDKILEINKRRIHIPNAQIKFFSNRQPGDIKEHNEPETDSTGDEQSKQNGKGYNEVPDETEQKRGIGGALATEVIEI